MITLYQLKRTWGIPNLSHFCVKAETYLRMAKLPYQVVETLPLKAPRGKVPYIEDNGKTIADTRLIVNHLKATYGDTLDAELSDEQKAQSHALQRLLEEHLFWATMYTRWNGTDANWQTNKQAIFSVLPPVARDLAALVYRRRIKGQIKGHGMGRHTPEEVFMLAQQDLDALSIALGDKPYFMGARPSTLDASAFGVLINTIGCPIESPIKAYGLAKPNLRNYCQRMLTEFYPEMPAMAGAA